MEFPLVFVDTNQQEIYLEKDIDFQIHTIVIKNIIELSRNIDSTNSTNFTKYYG